MTPQCHLGSTKGNPGKYLGLGERIYHKLMNSESIFKGNTSKTVTYDVGEYVCSLASWEVWGQHTVAGGL